MKKLTQFLGALGAAAVVLSSTTGILTHHGATPEAPRGTSVARQREPDPPPPPPPPRRDGWGMLAYRKMPPDPPTPDKPKPKRSDAARLV